MNERIGQALVKLFERHRIVFWYDAKQELRGDFEALSLPGIEKIEIKNNEYTIKYRLLCEEPEQKFLLYREGVQPADLDNWLLDVQLGQGEFRTDQVAIWLSELELDHDFAEMVGEHAEFFRAIKRKEALKKLLQPDDTRGIIRLKMLAICVGSEPLLDSVLGSLLQEVSGTHGPSRCREHFGANANNLLVTSDHGFIYQNRAIDESDFSGTDAEGDQTLFRDRRFVLGRGLREGSSLLTFTPSQLGLAGDVEVQIPKSINRLRPGLMELSDIDASIFAIRVRSVSCPRRRRLRSRCR